VIVIFFYAWVLSRLSMEHHKRANSNTPSYFRYESRRVITRANHPGDAFYLLISGIVLVNIQEVSESDGRPFIRTVNELGTGEAFGVCDQCSYYLNEDWVS